MQQKIHILGAGALGLLLASKMSRSGLVPSLIVKTKSLENYSAGIDFLTSTNGSPKKYFIEVSDKAKEASIEKLIICTKAQDAANAAKSVIKYLKPDAQVLLLQNGIGSQSEVARVLPNFEISAGVTTYAAYKQAPAKVVKSGDGEIKLGFWSGTNKQNAERWLTLLTVGGLNASIFEPIRIAIWQKLAINAVINTLTSEHECLNGKLAKPDMQPKVEALTQEIINLFDTLGIPEPFGGLPAEIDRVIYSTALNRSSMLQDYENSKSSELEYISGNILKAASAVNLPMPHQRGIYQTLKAKFSVNQS